MKYFGVIMLFLLCPVLLIGCINQSKDIGQVDDNDVVVSEDGEGGWETAYRDAVSNLEYHLVDPYDLRYLLNWIYLGIHDFDNDNIPELVLGDGASFAILTYKDNSLVKVADLYLPEQWAAINGARYKDNIVSIESNGSDGSGYVCFTYKNGEYINAFYDDYNPEVAIINDTEASRDEFNAIFSLEELQRGEIMTRIERKVDGANIYLGFETFILIEDLNFEIVKF